MNEFTLKILTPDKVFFNEPAQEIIFDTPDGRMGIMAGHMMMAAAVREGVIEIQFGGEWKTAAVSQGFAEIEGDLVEFFVDTVEWSDEIDAARAQQALERARLMMRSSANRIEYLRSQAAMARALARIKASTRGMSSFS